MNIPVPIRDLREGMWVLLEYAGLVRVTGLTWFPESVEIEYDGNDSPLARRVDRSLYGVWSGRFDDYPFIKRHYPEVPA